MEIFLLNLILQKILLQKAFCLVLKNNGIVILDYDKVLQEVEVNDKLGYIKPIFKDADKEKNIL